MKKYLITTLLLIFTSICYLYFYIGVLDIYALQNKFVETKLNDSGKPDYKIVKKKPKSWISLKEIPKKSYMAIVISEDWAFYDHDGFDYEQMEIAISDAILGKKVRGASTISQQLTKNLITGNDRTLLRKLNEFVATYFLERALSKTKILEIYLNIIQYGDSLYGINNASQKYFKKNATKLTTKEGAFLAMLLPSPVRYSQSFHDRELTMYASQIIERIILKLSKAHVITDDEAFEINMMPLSFEVDKSAPLDIH